MKELLFQYESDLTTQPTSLYESIGGTLVQVRGHKDMSEEAHEVQSAFQSLVQSSNYPCVPALLSFQRNQYLIGIYRDFGKGEGAQDLYRDLERFRKIQNERKKELPFFSFLAVFLDSQEMNEEQYEAAMWRELSALSSKEDPSTPWDSNFSDDPSHPKFCLSLGGEAFFVVGLHQESSRLARRFPWPTMVFNLYEQFEELSRQNRYEAIVKANRARELKYQGNLNPMVEAHGEKWEAIQFSGKKNSNDWKCPFHRQINK